MDWVVELRSPAATAIFLGLTALGDIAFYLVAIGLGYWLRDRRRYRLLGIVTLLGALLNSLLKAYFHVPRPGGIPVLAEADGYSFPSGHAQLAATFWCWWALGQGRRWAWIPAGLLVAGIAFSRVYLGVHFPRDVVAGIVVGLLTVVAGWRLAHQPPEVWRRLGAVQALVWAFLLAPIWLIFPAAIDHVAAIASGSLVGLALGSACLAGDAPMPSGGRQLALAALLGLASTFALRFGLKPPLQALPIPETLADALRYFLIALWMSWWAPGLFARLRAGDATTPAAEGPAAQG